MQVAAPAAFTLPLQLPIVEWGPLDGAGLPALGAAFDSGWFDTWSLLPERVINGRGGVQVETTADGFTAPGSNRRVGLYILEFFIRHLNNLGAPLPVTVEQIPAPALISVPFGAFTPALTFVVASAGFGGALDRAQYFSRRIRLAFRMVRVTFTYPAAGAAGAITDFYMGAALRAA